MTMLEQLKKLTTKELMKRTGFYRWEEPGSGYPFGLDYGYSKNSIVGSYVIQWTHHDALQAMWGVGVDIASGDEIPGDLMRHMEAAFGTPGMGAHWEVVATLDEDREDVIDLPECGLAFDLSLRDAFIAAYEHYLSRVAEAVREVPDEDRALLMSINA